LTVAQDNAFVAVSSGLYRLQAPLTFTSVADLREEGLKLIDSHAQELTLDLQAVPAVDSAGLALLIDWLGEARAKSRTLHYVQPPKVLLSLARLSEVEKLIAEG
jgi:phospholipid transport system transporter-binding protein